jgi:hypothetical protein
MTTGISPFVVLPCYHRLWEGLVAVEHKVELRYEGVVGGLFIKCRIEV